MLEGILDLVKNEALSAITGNADVPAEKQEAAVETTTSTIVDGLKSQLSLDNLGAITSLLGGSGATNNPIVSSIQGAVSSALTDKVGLNKGVSTMIASTVVPAIFNLFAKKNNDPNDSGFSVESLIKSFTGGGNNSNDGNVVGGILGALGNLLGGKK